MDSGFELFKERLNTFFEGEYPPELCIEVIFDIVEGNSVYYEFDFQHLRLTQDLLLAAILLSEWKKIKVVFLTATSYYSLQALRMVRGYQRFGVLCKTLSVGVAGIIPKRTLLEADVIMHHGRVYPLLESVHPKRTIVQIFKDEAVPHDTRSLSALISEARCYEDY
jgi:hypothetical protein